MKKDVEIIALELEEVLRGASVELRRLTNDPNVEIFNEDGTSNKEHKAALDLLKYTERFIQKVRNVSSFIQDPDPYDLTNAFGSDKQ
ncbi:MAG TPA: hypothetical protein VLA13_00835 [Massilibacterium sp.]|nr:hypothetical protein [Massilibacterium sp.]